jgi:comEA protein
MGSSNLKFWHKDWLAGLGISSHQIIVIVFLIVFLISGLVLSRIKDSSTKSVFNEDDNLSYSNFQAKVAEVESLYYAEKKRSNPLETVSFQKKVDINEASQKELIALPGIGPELSKRILDFRKKNGKFLAIEDLRKVKGIGVKKFNKMLPFIRIGNKEY